MEVQGGLDLAKSERVVGKKNRYKSMNRIGGNPINTTVTILGLVFFLVFSLFPFLWMGITSVKHKEDLYLSPPVWIPEDTTFDHYRQIAKMGFGRFTLNSLGVASVVTVIVVVLSVLAAYGFSRLDFKGKGFLLPISLLGQLMPQSVMFVPFHKMMSSLGLIDTYWALIIVYTALSLPFSIWLLTGYLESIPYSLDEAAMVDGCSRLQTMIRIVIPTAIPGIVSVAFYAFIISWQEFLFALIFINDTRLRTLPLALASFKGQYEINWGALMAGAMTTTLPTAIFFVVLQRLLIPGLTAGAVKE